MLPTKYYEKGPSDYNVRYTAAPPINPRAPEARRVWVDPSSGTGYLTKDDREFIEDTSPPRSLPSRLREARDQSGVCGYSRQLSWLIENSEYPEDFESGEFSGIQFVAPETQPPGGLTFWNGLLATLNEADNQVHPDDDRGNNLEAVGALLKVGSTYFENVTGSPYLRITDDRVLYYSQGRYAYGSSPVVLLSPAKRLASEEILRKSPTFVFVPGEPEAPEPDFD